jgi:hypothetical protein
VPILNAYPVRPPRNEFRAGRIRSAEREIYADEGTTNSDPNAPRLGARVLREAGVIHEREEHGWAKDRADPQAGERAFDIVRQDPPSGASRVEAAIELDEVLGRSATLAPNVRRDVRRAKWPQRKVFAAPQRVWFQ